MEHQNRIKPRSLHYYKPLSVIIYLNLDSTVQIERYEFLDMRHFKELKNSQLKFSSKDIIMLERFKKLQMFIELLNYSMPSDMNFIRVIDFLNRHNFKLIYHST